VEVARDLLGAYLVHGPCVGRIVETEAYIGLDDLAAHASRGLTARTRVIFGPPGHAYVYLIYGMYECLNLVAEPDGVPGCVLIRALEPVGGIERMRQRRPTARRLEDLASGPGKLTLALGITRRHNGVDVTRGSFVVRRPAGFDPVPIAVSPRVGITHCADWPLRFYIEGNRFVSRVGKASQPRQAVMAPKREDIAAYAAEHAGTREDLDPELEAATLEILNPASSRQG
jgi:DNA-3-methyladenine glycosylase